MIINRPNLLYSLQHVLENMKTSIAEKFMNFYNAKIVESGLAAKTFNFPFNIGSTGSSAHRRSISKLKVLLAKQLNKINPQIAFAVDEFLNTGSADDIRISISNSGPLEDPPPVKNLNKYLAELKVKFPSISERLLKAPTFRCFQELPSGMDLYLENTPEFKFGIRYARYLNYLFRKYGVPLVVKFDVELNAVARESSNSRKYKMASFFTFSFISWYCASEEDIERFVKIQGGSEDDALFSTPSSWITRPLDARQRHTDDSRSIFEKYHLSKVFLHIDKATKILTSLSRKIDYDYSAFDFRVD